MTAREAALVIIDQEHRSLAQVLHTLKTLLQRIEAGVAVPEFELFSAALCYIDDFQERCHHPKEEEYIFKSLRAAAPAFDGVIGRLEAGHQNGAQAMAGLYRGLVHFQGGVPQGLQSFSAAVETYAQALFEHMREEEALFAQCADILTEPTWLRIASAFEENDDPLFGANRREQFRRLLHRIQRLTPRKLKQRAGAVNPAPAGERR